MDKLTVAKELAEEIRTNVALRHRIGMDEGSDSDLVENDSDAPAIGITTLGGDQFFIEVKDV